MSILGVLSGTIIMDRSDLLKNCRTIRLKNEFGSAQILINNKIALISRHGNNPHKHILPHLINNRANLKAFQDLGITEIVGINSTGSLKKRLRPGTIVIPDDFMTFTATPETYGNKELHIIPSLDEKVRQKMIRAAGNCGIKVVKKGVYWQTPGPRLETKAEIRMMAAYADIVGMTMANEAVAAIELGLHYASACSVDNFGNGLTKKPLGLKEIIAGSRKNADLMIRLIESYLEL